MLPVLKIGKLSKAGKAGEFAKAGTLGKVIDPGRFLKPKIDPAAPGGALFPKDYDPLGGLAPDEFLTKYWNPDKVDRDGDRGGWNYPPDEGFDHSPGVPPPEVVKGMRPGDTFDRFGNPTGAYVSPEGTSFPERALPPQSAELDYHSYELAKPFDTKSGFPTEGTVAPAFGQPGGGTQIKLPKKVEWLIEHGYLKEKVLK